jgi:hypothetical protein
LTQNSQKQYVGCEIYIRNDKELYDQLFKNKDAIEKELGFELEWMELPDANASRIIITHKGDPRNRDKWQEYNEWLLKTADLFARVFIKYIK